MMDWGYMGTGFGAMALVWVLGLLLVVGAVVAVVVALDRAGRAEGTGHGSVRPEPSSAERELELRYARGEIDAATFVEQRTVLRHG